MASVSAVVMDTATTVSVEEWEQTRKDFDDIIHWDYFEQDNGKPHDEACMFYDDECDQIARFWLTPADGSEKRLYCPKHFALVLHDLIDAIAHSAYFAKQKTRRGDATCFARSFWNGAARILMANRRASRVQHAEESLEWQGL